MKPAHVAALALSLACFAGALAHGAEARGGSNAIPYISGGIGQESREALRAKKDEYNLMVIMSLKDGHYLGGAALTIRDHAGKAVLELVAQGPWVLAKLPPGTYDVDAKVGNAPRSGRVTVGTKGLKRVHLTWDREPA